jgi:hypothetical protein
MLLWVPRAGGFAISSALQRIGRYIRFSFAAAKGAVYADERTNLYVTLDNIARNAWPARPNATLDFPLHSWGISMKKNGHRQVLLPLVCFAARAMAWTCLALMSALVLSPPAAAQVCQWFGTPPVCAGECPSGYYDTGQRQGCFTGSKAYCCRIECGAQ